MMDIVKPEDKLVFVAMEAGAEDLVDIKDELPASLNRDTFPFDWTTSETTCPRNQWKFSNSELVIPSSCLEESTDRHVIKYLKAPQKFSIHVQDEPVGTTLLPDRHESTHKKMYPSSVAVKKEASVGTNDISPVSRLETNFLTPTVKLVRLENSLDPAIKKYLAKIWISANPVKLESVDLGTLSYETIYNISVESNDVSVVGFPKNIEIDQREKIHDETPSQKSLSTTNSCDKCQKSFARTTELAIHNCSIARKKSFQCDLCQKRLSRKSCLIHHMHTHRRKKRHKCAVCQKICLTSNGLKKHVAVHNRGIAYNCDSCQRSFEHKSTWKRHMDTHSGKKRHKCDICKKSFSQRRHMTTHMFTHTGEKQHHCDSCQKSFVHKSALKRHMNVHTGEKRHKCDKCHMSFGDKSNLKRHMVIHTGEKRYRCDICDKTFTQKCNLKRHSYSHRKKKPV